MIKYTAVSPVLEQKALLHLHFFICFDCTLHYYIKQVDLTPQNYIHMRLKCL